MRTNRDLTDSQWAVLDPLIPEPSRRKDGRGCPWRARRPVLDGILWVLRSGAPWADLPERYPSYQTCHRRFQQWVRSGIMRGVLEALAEDLRSRGGFDLEEAFIDGSFAPAKKGDPAWAIEEQWLHAEAKTRFAARKSAACGLVLAFTKTLRPRRGGYALHPLTAGRL